MRFNRGQLILYVTVHEVNWGESVRNLCLFISGDRACCVVNRTIMLGVNGTSSSSSRATQVVLHSSKTIQSRPLSVEALSSTVRKFVEENARVCQPKNIYVCDGSEEESQKMMGELVDQGRLRKLTKYDNW